MPLLADYFTLAQPAKAVHSHGVVVFVGDFVVPTPPALDPFVALPQMRRCTWSGHQFTKIDVSHLFSPAKYKEFIPGFGEGGTIEMTFLYSGGVFANLRNLLPTIFTDNDEDTIGDSHAHPVHSRWRLRLYDPYGSYIECSGFFQGPGQETPEDGVLMTTVTFEISGKPRYYKHADAF